MEMECVLCDEICCVRKNVDDAFLEPPEVKALCKLLQLTQFPFEGQVRRARFCCECKADIREAMQIYEKMAKHDSKLTTIREKLQNKLAIFSTNVQSTTLYDVKDSRLVPGTSVPVDIFRKEISQHLITVSQPGLKTTGTSSCQMLCASTQSDLTPGFVDVKNEEVQTNIARADKETQIAECAHSSCHSKMDVLPEDITSTIVSADSPKPSTSKCCRNKSVLSCSHSPESSNRTILINESNSTETLEVSDESNLITELNSTETLEDSDEPIFIPEIDSTETLEDSDEPIFIAEIDSTETLEDSDESVSTDDCEYVVKRVLDSSPGHVDANGPNTAFLPPQGHSSCFRIDGENINICEIIDVNTSVTPVMGTSGSSLQPEGEPSYENGEDETDDPIGEITKHSLRSASDIAVNCEIPLMPMNDVRPAIIEASPPMSSSKPVNSIIPKQTPMILIEKLSYGKMKAGQSSLVCKPDVGSSMKTAMSKIHDPKYVTGVIGPTSSQGNIQGSEGTSVVQPGFNEDEVSIINEVCGSDSAMQHQTLAKNQELNRNPRPVAPALAPANQNKNPALENANASASGSGSTMIALHPEINQHQSPIRKRGRPKKINSSQSETTNNSTLVAPTPAKKTKSTPVAPTPGKKTKLTPVEPTPAKKTKSTPIAPTPPNKNNSTPVAFKPRTRYKSTPFTAEMNAAVKAKSRLPESPLGSNSKSNGISSRGRIYIKKETV